MPTPLPTDPSCIFCKIVAGQIPCYKVYEDDLVLAFLDIGPLVTGHTLVIPKGHYASLTETPGEVAAEIGRRLPALGKAVMGALGAKACNFLINNGVEAQQSIGHLHIHVLPRGLGESFRIPWVAGKVESGEAKLMAGKIAERMGS